MSLKLQSPLPIFTFRKVLFVFTFLYFIHSSNANTPLVAPGLLPGAKVYDVTKPETYGGTLRATPNDASDNDAIAINEAIRIATTVAIKASKNKKIIFQQVILIPKGDYHLDSTIVLPRIGSKRESGIWIYGEGIDKTRFLLKSAKNIGLFGSENSPKPVMQYAPYTYEREGAGNINFQLWGTDYSIIIPSDQPYAVGMSYGCANMGALRNVHIKAEGNAGHTGLAMLQFNNGPGWIEGITIEGFNTGIEISDGWGEIFSLRDIKLINQNKGGVGVSIADKLMAIEGLVSEQIYDDVTPVLLIDDKAPNSEYGGAPHLTLLNSKFTSKVKSKKPIVKIITGHSFIRNISSKGYGEAIINDHGVDRIFKGGIIKDEYISVHGKTAEEKKNVVLTYENAPAKSINLPSTITPEVDKKVWEKLAAGNYTLVDSTNMVNGKISVKTDWVIVDPSKSGDDTELLQAALNSGARYVGLMNNEKFIISRNIVVNKNNGKVELIYGHMSEIFADSILQVRENIDITNDKTLITFETGNVKSVTIKGIHFVASDWTNSDMLLFQNNSANTLIFEDLRSKQMPRAYRNGKESYGKQVFFENVEFAYTGAFYDIIMKFDHQNVIARQFNLEAPIAIEPTKIHGKTYLRFTDIPKLYNNGSNICVISQKFGELNGVFVETVNGGKTELLSAYFNAARTIYNTDTTDLCNFEVSGKNSDFCLVGQERIRTTFVDNNATLPLPNKNRYGIYISEGKEFVVEGTSLPTYLKFPNIDPFSDTDYETYDKKNRFRMTGLLRVITK